MARQYYQGKFTPKNPTKYVGNVSNIIYRSSWELATFVWCDENPDIVRYSSEEITITYKHVDGTTHRYFVDLLVEFKNGSKYLVEIKPLAQTIRPKPKQGQAKRVLLEQLETYSKNVAKWTRAIEYAKMNNMVFAVWTEVTLRKLGIRIIANKPKQKQPTP